MAQSGSLGNKCSESPNGHQDYGNWSAPSKDDNSVWGNKSEIIVDTQDTEAWPSIGDEGERSSDNICKSVISSSTQQPSPVDCPINTSARSADAAGDSSAWMSGKAPSSSTATAAAPWNITSSTTSGASTAQQQTLGMGPATADGSSSGTWNASSHNNSLSGAAAWQDNPRDHKGSGDASSWSSNGAAPVVSPSGWSQSVSSQGGKAVSVDAWPGGSHWSESVVDAVTTSQEKGSGDEWAKNQGNAQAQWSKSGVQWQTGCNTTVSPAAAPGSVCNNQPWSASGSSAGDMQSNKSSAWSFPANAKVLAGKGTLKPGDAQDAIQALMIKAINTTESWGRTPIRQDAAWTEHDTVEGRKKGEDTNTWNSMPNNGTGIWESLRKNAGGPGCGTTSWDDKKSVAYGLVTNSDDDPYVWNPTSKSKDNAMWDDVSKDGDSEVQTTQNLWHSAPSCGSPSWGVSGSSNGRGRNGNGNSQSSRTPSVSSGSGGDGAANGAAIDGAGWGSRGSPGLSSSSAAPVKAVHSVASPADVKPTGWGGIDEGLPTSANNSGHPDTGPPHWTSAQGKSASWNAAMAMGPSGAAQQSLPKDWMQKGEGSTKLWDQPSGSNSEWNGSGQGPWLGSDAGKMGRTASQWDSGHQEWPGGPAANRRIRSESDAHGWGEDAEIGEWNEQHRRDAVWTSAGQRRTALPNKHSANPAVLPNKMMNGIGQLPISRQQTLQTLLDMGYPKENAMKALLDNEMDLSRTIADLRSGASQQGSGQPPHMLPSAMSEAMPSTLNPHLPNMHPNTPLINNAQAYPNTKSFIQGSSSRQHHKTMPQQQQLPFGGSNRFPPQAMVQQMHQQQVLQNLQHLITAGLIPANAVSRPQNSQIIESMLKLFSMYQSLSSSNQLMHQQVQQNRGCSSLAMQQALENMQHNQAKLNQVKVQLIAVSKHLSQQQHQNQAAENNLLSDMSSLTVNAPSGNQPLQSQSRLYQWKQPIESEMSVPSQSNRAPGSKPIHASYSSPNLHGGLNIGSDSTWSTNSSTGNWPSNSSAKTIDGNHIESHSPSLDSQIPEFIPGQPWQGMSSQKIDEDPAASANANKQFATVNTAVSNGLEPFGVSGGESWPGYNFSKNVGNAGSNWMSNSASPPGALGIADPWNSSSKVSVAPGRPPPGLPATGNTKNFAGLNRSVSWAPGASGWDRPASQWLMIHNLAAQVDGATLKSLCLQYGQLSNFYLNLHLGQAFVQYNYAQDAIKAQKSLSSCVLSNATLVAEFIGDDEVTRLIEHGSRQNQPGRSGFAQWPNSSNPPQMPTWSSGASASSAVGSLWSSNSMSALDSSTGANSNQSFVLPGDLLGTNDFSM